MINSRESRNMETDVRHCWRIGLTYKPGAPHMPTSTGLGISDFDVLEKGLVEIQHLQGRAIAKKLIYTETEPLCWLIDGVEL